MFPLHRNAAFSLVELSIVLVILGLLTGGILAGQSLIRAAELRSVSSDYARYTTALQSFRDRYMALPGDMPNAVKFWGAQAGGTTNGVDATCAALTTAATGAATCNGDGNGRIGTSGTTQQYEEYRAWQQLANAGLIEGSYSGVPSTPYSVVATNIPASKISQSGFSFWSIGTLATNGTYNYAGSYGNTLQFGAQHTSSISITPNMSPEEAWNIDIKSDDGKPGTGSVLSFINSSRPNCADSDTASSAVYQLTVTSKGCNLAFKLGM